MRMRLVWSGFISAYLVLLLSGCSGSSDSGTESFAGRYTIAVNQINAQTGAIENTTIPGTMTILASNIVDATYTNDANGTAVVTKLSGNITPAGVITMRSTDGRFPPTFTGTVTGSGANKKVTNGSVTFKDLPTVKTKWSAQCTSDCG